MIGGKPGPGNRIRLETALESLDALNELPLNGLTADELEIIRASRAREMIRAANALFTELTGQPISNPRGV